MQNKVVHQFLHWLDTAKVSSQHDLSDSCSDIFLSLLKGFIKRDGKDFAFERQKRLSQSQSLDSESGGKLNGT